MIMASIPDVTSLHNLLCVAKASRPLFAASFKYIFPEVVANNMPRDLQEMVFTVISIEDHAPFQDVLLPFFLNSNIASDERKGHLQFLKPPQDPVKVLHRMARIINAMDFFTGLFPKLMGSRHSNFEGRILSATEIHRLHRGLWRFEVCCALTAAWMPGDMDTVVSGSDTRLPRLTKFLGQFCLWELEELASVYDFLEMAVMQYGKVVPPSGFMVEVDKYGKVSFQHYNDDVIRFRSQHAGSLPGRRSAICNVGLFAVLNPEAPSVSTYKAASRARILSEGLVFLRSFQQQPLSVRQRMEWNLIGCSLGDEFIQAALHSPLALHSRTLRVEEPVTLTRRQWMTMFPNLETDRRPADVLEKARQDWITFAVTSGWYARLLAYPVQSQLRYRSWAYAIWDDLLEWGKKCYRGEYCPCHICSDTAWCPHYGRAPSGYCPCPLDSNLDWIWNQVS